MIVVIAVEDVRGRSRRCRSTPMVHALNRIDTWMKANAPGIELGLHPPVKREQVEALAKQRGVKVPDEVYSLYAWHDGAGANTVLFGEYQFLPVAEAFAYGDALRKAHPSDAYRLPLFRSRTSARHAYTADCQLPGIIGKTGCSWSTQAFRPQTETLTGFLSALAQSFEKGFSAPV